MNAIHRLTTLNTAEVPGEPNMVVLCLEGDDGAHERFVVERGTLEEIIAALGRHLLRQRDHKAVH